jgi:anti-sigma regulatory factor (Ser/Thr protein kinase)
MIEHPTTAGSMARPENDLPATPPAAAARTKPITPTPPAHLDLDNPLVALQAAVRRESFHLQLPTRPEIIEPAVLLLKDRAERTGACAPEQSCALTISLTEAITNAVIHGNLEVSSHLKELPENAFSRRVAERSNDPHYAQRVVDVTVDDDGEKCVWTVTDQGPGFAVNEMLATLDAQEPQLELASGRGLMLMRALMSNVNWSQHGRRVSMTLNRNTSAAAHAARPAVTQANPFDLIPSNAPAITAEQVQQIHRLILEVDGKSPQMAIAEVESITALPDGRIALTCRSDTPEPLVEPGGLSQIEMLLARTYKSPNNTHEARRDARRIYTEPVTIHLPNGDRVTGVARNLSRTGMAFVADVRLPKEMDLILTLAPESAAPLQVIGRVVRSGRIAAAFFDYGVKFVGDVVRE